MVCEIVALVEYDTLELPLELEDTETLPLVLTCVCTITRAVRTINLRSDAMVQN
jgi:hypothetical protein